MNTVKIGNVCFGEGRTKLIVPLTEKNGEDIAKTMPSLLASPADMIEWRIDLLERAEDVQFVLPVLSEISGIIEGTGKDIPLLATYRTMVEGGNGSLNEDDYFKLLYAIIDTGKAEAIDVELCHSGNEIATLIEYAHKTGVKVIVSSHDFEKTPPVEAIKSKLLDMKALKCDIAKIAVMPKSGSDVITLMEATKELFATGKMPPMITMSMGEMGVVSRAFGTKLGSCASFASCGKSSAPGQIGIDVLSYILCLE